MSYPNFMRDLTFYHNLKSLAIVSYSAYEEYSNNLIEILEKDFKEVCIFPFETKNIISLKEQDKKYYISVDELDTSYGSLSRLSRIYAFENFLKECLRNNLTKGIVCSQDILVTKAIMNTLFSFHQIKYVFQRLKGFDKIYAVHFKKVEK